jgi:hypothetical protein
MRNTMISGTALLAALATGEPTAGGATGDAPPKTAPAADLHPALKKLGVMVGGRRVTEGKNADGVPFGELRYTWGPDGRSLVSSGVLRPGGSPPIPIEARFGWDPVAKKV